MFAVNTSRPLFAKNPKLRQAVNFAVDRRALGREFGPLAATITLGASQFGNYRAVEVGKPGYIKVEEVAQPPQVAKAMPRISGDGTIA